MTTVNAGILHVLRASTALSLLFFPLPGAAQQPVPAADSASLHAFWATLDSTWAARDAEAFTRLFTEDGTLEFPDRGSRLEAHEGILRHFVAQFGRQSPVLRHRTRVDAVRHAGPGAVEIEGEVRVVNPEAESGEAVLARFTISGTMVRRGDGWRIRHLRADQIKPAP